MRDPLDAVAVVVVGASLVGNPQRAGALVLTVAGIHRNPVGVDAWQYRIAPVVPSVLEQSQVAAPGNAVVDSGDPTPGEIEYLYGDRRPGGQLQQIEREADPRR